MASRRQRKVAELLHEEISQLIQFQSQDPRLRLVTVTGVEVSPDLRYAQVYVTALGDETETKNALKGLKNAAGFFRFKLGQTLTLRYVPELTFKLDTSLEQGMLIENLLESIREKEEPAEDSPEADDSES